VGSDWRPDASFENLQLRARILGAIRAFFAERGVVEVETPLLSRAAVTDPYLAAFRCRYEGPGSPEGETLYLQTSPEYAMKRLLAAGSGPIYQLGKAFRNGEAGRHHNPEFTLLEWYRPGFTHHDLMDEMDALLCEILGASPAERLSYRTLFERELALDPHTAAASDLHSAAHAAGVGDVQGLSSDDRDGWLDLLMTHAIEARLGLDRPVFVYDYPESQAALARVRPENPPVAERFEVYVRGIELANGFHELTDAREQRRRFETNLDERRRLGLEEMAIDEKLLAALEHGLPSSAGVALGVDRLVMISAGAPSIQDVIAFPFERA